MQSPIVNGFVGAQHEFHDADFVQGWADRFVPSAPRLALFDMILAQIHQLPASDPNVLELGLGPGYMARHILERQPTLRYEGLDFSDVSSRWPNEPSASWNHVSPSPTPT
jgi:hypothetical protein